MIFSLSLFFSFSLFASMASELPKEKVKVPPFHFEYDSKNNKMTLAPEHLNQAYCQGNRKNPSGVTYQCCENTKKSQELDKTRGKNNKFYHCQKTGSSGSIFKYYLLVGTSNDNTKTHISTIDSINPNTDSLFHYVYEKGKRLEEANCGIKLSDHVEYDHGKDEFSRFVLPHKTSCFHIQGDEHKGLCSYALKVAKENSTEKDWQNFQTFLETEFKKENKILYERFYLDILFTRTQLVENKGMLKPKFLKEEHSQKISKKAIDNLFARYYEGVKENLDKKLLTTLEKTKEDSYFKRRLIKRCKKLIEKNQNAATVEGTTKTKNSNKI